MIFLHHARLVILSQPKTGTTALDNALAGRASIAVSGPPQIKHMRYNKFMTFIAPWIESQAGLARTDYEVVSVMREPVDWLGSWYRYRMRNGLRRKTAKSHIYTGGISFDDFVQQVIKVEDRPPYARIGTPCSISTEGRRQVGA